MQRWISCLATLIDAHAHEIPWIFTASVMDNDTSEGRKWAGRAAELLYCAVRHTHPMGSRSIRHSIGG